MKILRNVTTGMATVSELIGYFWEQRRWWLIPFVIVLLLLGALIVIGEVTGIAPFIYTLF